MRDHGAVIICFYFKAKAALDIVRAAPEAESFHASLNGLLETTIHKQKIYVLHILGETESGGKHHTIILEEQAASNKTISLAHFLPDAADHWSVFKHASNPRVGRGADAGEMP